MKTLKEDYRRYLQSPAWAATRERRLQVVGHRCEFRPETCWDAEVGPLYGERCKSMTGLDVHHKTYSRLGSEADADLEVLAGCIILFATRCTRTTASCAAIP